MSNRASFALWCLLLLSAIRAPRLPRCSSGWEIPPAPSTPSCMSSSEPGTPAADSVSRILGAGSAAPLWAMVRQAPPARSRGTTGCWPSPGWRNCGSRAVPTAFAAWRGRIEQGEIPGAAGRRSERSPAGAACHRARADPRPAAATSRSWRSCCRAFPRASTTWATPGCSAGSGRGPPTRSPARFLETSDRNLRIRYLTLLSFSRDTLADPAVVADLCRARQLQPAASASAPAPPMA